MKKFILNLFILIILPLKSFAIDNIISTIIIDEQEEQEIDIVMDKEQMYLPCKFFLKYFEIPYKESHAEKSLSINTKAGNITLKGDNVYIGGEKQSSKVFFIKKCFTGIQNEYFTTAEILSKITGKKISAVPSQLLVFMETREKTLQEKKEGENPFLVKESEPVIKAYEEITLPVQKGFLSVDSVGFRNNMTSDSYSQIYLDKQSSNANFANNMQMTFKGMLNSGEYTVDFGTNSYTRNMFAFSGISPKYKNQFKNWDYVVGKIDPWDFADGDLSGDIMGVQFKEHIAEENNLNFRTIEGTVSPTSTVKVYINDDFKQDVSTFGGIYSLKNIVYNKPVKTIKVFEMFEDGSEKEVFSKEYKFQSELSFKKKQIPQKDLFLGISGLQNRLWANNGYLYQSTTRKAVFGAKYKKDISEKLRFENFVLADKIIPGSNDENWQYGLLGNRKYINFFTMQNPNVLEGETYMASLCYDNSERMFSKAIFGGSHSYTKDPNTQSGLGYFLQLENNYKINPDTIFKTSVFSSSPEFYMAGYASGGGGGFMADRTGSSISLSTKYKNVSMNGSYMKYKTNFGSYYPGGLMDYDEYNFLASANFTKLPSLRFRINNRSGKNEAGLINSGTYEFSTNKRFKQVSFNGGIRSNYYQNEYTIEDYTGYNSEFSNIFAETSFPLGKMWGNIALGHEITEMKSDNVKNNYNTIRIRYNTPSIKDYNLNLSTGFHYTGTQKGMDWGLGITKRLKSGSCVSLNYKYSQIPCYVIDNMFLPGSMRHSITIDFSELYGLGDLGLKAIGTGNENKGYLQASAFLDLNQNGIRDKNEPMLENIPIKMENLSEPLLTDKHGKTKLKAEEAGVYNVKVYEDELPTLVCCHSKTKSSRYIKLCPHNKTKVEFGLISTVGNVNGTVMIKDEFEKPLKVDDLIVSLIDANGKELNYTNLNEDGTFSFSGLTPGKYIVEIDRELQNLYKIKPESKSVNYIVTIPPVYKDYVNIDNVNLNYRYEI